MRIVPPLVALLLGAATAFVVACGNDGRIPASDASRVENALNEVEADFQAGKCQDAEQAVARARGALLNLPDSVDSQLRSRLRSGVAALSERVPATCGQAQTQTQPTPTDSTPTDTTTTDTTGTDTTGTGTDTTGTGTDTTGTDTTGTGTEPPTTNGTTGTGTGTGTTDTGTGGATPGGGG